LLCQAALGLHTAHQANLTHGHLQPGLIVLDGEGILKLCGFGEPPWLADVTGTVVEGDEASADLIMLGQIAAGWANPSVERKGAKLKPLAEALQAVMERLTTTNPEARYPNAAALLEDLDRVGADVPANAAAWERLVRHVREQTADNTTRQSA
jgi:hypothetical protein